MKTQPRLCSAPPAPLERPSGGPTRESPGRYSPPGLGYLSRIRGRFGFAIARTRHWLALLAALVSGFHPPAVHDSGYRRRHHALGNRCEGRRHTPSVRTAGRFAGGMLGKLEPGRKIFRVPIDPFWPHQPLGASGWRNLARTQRSGGGAAQHVGARLQPRRPPDFCDRHPASRRTGALQLQDEPVRYLPLRAFRRSHERPADRTGGRSEGHPARARHHGLVDGTDARWLADGVARHQHSGGLRAGLAPAPPGWRRSLDTRPLTRRAFWAPRPDRRPLPSSLRNGPSCPRSARS